MPIRPSFPCRAAVTAILAVLAAHALITAFAHADMQPTSLNSPQPVLDVARAIGPVVRSPGAGSEIRVGPMTTFHVGYNPDTWFAGPDLAVLDARFGWSGPPRMLDITDWRALPDLGGSGLSCDSLTLRPAERPAHRTFFEIYRDRLYVRSDGDTVHLNSWVVLHGGGADLDSPYHVVVAPGDPALDDTLACAAAGTPWAVRPAGLVGSPIGFKHQYTIFYSPGGPTNTKSQSPMFPNYDVASVFRMPVMGAYLAVPFAGKAYVVLRSQDADGLFDARIQNPRALVEAVDSGMGTPEQVALRSNVLVFHVDRAPYLLYDDPGFVPRPGHAFTSRTLALHLAAADDDPLDTTVFPSPPGGPSLPGALRWNVTLRGRDVNGAEVVHSPLSAPVFTPDIQFEVPTSFADPHLTIDVELCDCAACETEPGRGRCATYSIPVTIPDGTTGILATLVTTETRPDRVVLTWSLTAGARAFVERRAGASGWSELGEVIPDGAGVAVYEDREIEPGGRYAYRLAVEVDGVRATAGETIVEVPARPRLALEGIHPNPSDGRSLVVAFVLGSARSAQLEVLDVTGRRVERRAVGSLGAGRHTVLLSSNLAPGLYLVRLTQQDATRTARAVVLRGGGAGR